MNQRKRSALLLGAIVLAGCGGSAQYASVGGTVSGLQGYVVILQNNKTDDLVLTKDQPFVFTTPVSIGNSYDVSVRLQPLGRTCVVGGGSGVIGPAGNAVTTIGVNCSITSSVVGLLVGLRGDDGGLTLGLNGVPLLVTNSGFFEFPVLLPPSSPYSVTVIQNPTKSTCRIFNANGIIATNATTYIEVSCIRPDQGPGNA